MKNIIIGTAGHIDHGKTSLVKALTGIDADRLKEEKQRGITIDIGFADLALEGIRFGFVDVPGHERFVKNMLAGAHGIDLVMLVIAADEAVMPQTREHFDICRLLHIKTGLTVLTKADMVDAELLELAQAEVSDYVAGSFLADAPIIPVSSKTGQGLEELKRTLVKLAKLIEAKSSSAIPRLPIDRSFTIKGFGTVVTGTLTSGQLKLADEVDILPGTIRTRVRGLQVHGQSTQIALAGQRTAINLQGVSLDQVERGQILVPAGRFQATSMLDVELELLPTAAKAITQRARVRLHHDTAEIMARVVLLGGNELLPGQKMFAQLRLEAPTFALPGDRFIIRRYSPQITIGGGVIIDAQPVKHRLKDRLIVPLLTKLNSSNDLERTALFIEMAATAGTSLIGLAARTGFTDEKLNQLVTELVRTKRILTSDTSPSYLLAKPAYEQFKAAILKIAKDFHTREPLQAGIGREELRVRVFADLPSELFKLVIDQLVKDNLVVAERDLVRHISHKIALDSQEQTIKQALEEKFKAVGFQALTYEEVAKEFKLEVTKLRRIYQLLLNEQKLIKVGELVFHQELIEQLITKIKAQKAQSTKLDVATFKDLTGVSRKHAIPLLEYLDMKRITRRVGNDREII